MKKILLTLALSLGLSAFATSYEVIDLFADTPFEEGIPTAINQHGEVVGEIFDQDGNRCPYRWNEKEGLRLLDLPKCTEVGMYNDRGGMIYLNMQTAQTFVLDPNGKSTLLQFGGKRYTLPFDMNQNGNVLCILTNDFDDFEFTYPICETCSFALWNHGQWTLLDEGVIFTSLNDHNEIVGTKEGEGVVLWKDGISRFLAMPDIILPTTINNSGEVLIALDDRNAPWLLWETATDQPPKKLTFDTEPSFLFTMNDCGQMLCEAEGLYHRKGQQCTCAELVEIVTAHPAFAEADDIEFTDVNNAGWVTGYVEMEDYTRRPFVLKPGS